MYKITITDFEDKDKRAFNVRVGCKQFVFHSQQAMLLELAEYLNDPIGIEEMFHRVRELQEGCETTQSIPPPILDTGSGLAAYAESPYTRPGIGTEREHLIRSQEDQMQERVASRLQEAAQEIRRNLGRGGGSLGSQQVNRDQTTDTNY